MSAGKGCAVVAGTFLGGVVAILLEALVLMLLLAGLHGFVSESVPALGYGGSILVVLALNFVSAFFKR